MRPESTKDKFLFEAMRLFGEKGYEAVKLSEIAEAVGCVPSALYKHFSSKEELYNAIIERSTIEYNRLVDRMRFDAEEKVKYINQTEEGQIAAIKNVFLHFLHSEGTVWFRRLMVVEQFKNSQLAALYNERYVFTQYERHADLFKILMEEGKLRKADPYTLSFMYISPIHVLLALCDRNPEKEEWALETIEKHIKEFNRQYRIPDDVYSPEQDETSME